MGRALRELRRVEHHRRGERRLGRRRRAEGGDRRAAGRSQLVPLSGETESAARIDDRHRRTRPGDRRRLRHGLGRAGRRRSGHRQVDAAAAGGGGAGQSAASASSMSRAKRRWRRSGCGRSGSGSATRHVLLASETNVEIILATLQTRRCRRDLVIIDSIQTLWTDRVDSAPGTVTQVRTSAQALTRFAKKSGAAVVLVGHVTKDGQIAGPRVVEHMVDAVLYFEGDASHTFRILRGVKNRYGATDEIGVFEMTDAAACSEVANPSALFLDQRDKRRRRLGGVRRHGGHAPGAVRNPGAGRALPARHAAPRRGRLGFVAPLDGAGRARNPLRRADRRQRHLSQRRRRAEDQRAGGRPRRGGGADLLADRLAAAAPMRSISARSRWPAGCGRWCMPRCGCARRRSSASQAPVTGRLGPADRQRRSAGSRIFAQLRRTGRRESPPGATADAASTATHAFREHQPCAASALGSGRLKRLNGFAKRSLAGVERPRC